MTRLEWLKEQVKQLRDRPTMDCVEWPFAKNKAYDGYGQVGYNGKLVLVHRLVYQLYHGKEPKQLVLHTCDNTICFNPEHLYCADAKQNAQDVLDHYGHWPNSHKKLNEDDVREILELLETNVTQMEIADRFDISQSLVSAISLGQIWQRVSEDRPIKKKQPPRRTKAIGTKGYKRLMTHEVVEIINMLSDGVFQDVIANKFGVSQSAISAINIGGTWQHLPRPWDS